MKTLMAIDPGGRPIRRSRLRASGAGATTGCSTATTKVSSITSIGNYYLHANARVSAAIAGVGRYFDFYNG
jgi:hypothetical protein